MPVLGTYFTRVEVIDETGRVYVNMDCAAYALIQDEGRTLKVFVSAKERDG